MAGHNQATYTCKSEPSSADERRRIWAAAFGLQAVDNLQPSAYVRDLADKNVAGTMPLEEVGANLERYYAQRGRPAREEEADKVSHRIVELLEEGAFALDSHMPSIIHQQLFQGIDDDLYWPGAYKDELLIKCEPILNGDSVLYGSPSLCQRSLDMLFGRELAHSYDGYADGPALSWFDANELASFVANVWMVHPFREGNTRTIAVFLELYLRSMGFDVSNEPFERHATFFRNALVRATYQNRTLGVALDTSHLLSFISRVVEGEKVPLDYDALWCIPLFRHPDGVRNVSRADAEPMQERLAGEGVAAHVLSLG